MRNGLGKFRSSYWGINMPPNGILLRTDNETQFNKYVVRSGWASYFVYPRQLIYEDEKDELPGVYQKVTHFTVADAWGNDKMEMWY